MAGKAWRGSSIAFGEFGLKAMECGWITARQIEAARVAMTRSIKRGGKVWIRLFPDKPITKKPAETRMGKGKGAPEEWVAVIRPGQDPVRNGRRGPGDGAGRDAAGSPQAADQDQVCRPGRRGVTDMKAQKVRDLDEHEIKQQLREMDEQMFRLHFQMSMGQMDGLKKVRQMKKDRARIYTILRERELAGEKK